MTTNLNSAECIVALQEREAELSDLQNQLGGAPDGWANRVSLVKVNNVRASLNSERRE